VFFKIFIVTVVSLLYTAEGRYVQARLKIVKKYGRLRNGKNPEAILLLRGFYPTNLNKHKFLR